MITFNAGDIEETIAGSKFDASNIQEIVGLSEFYSDDQLFALVR